MVKKSIFSIILISVGLIFTGTPVAADYDHTLNAKDMTVSWSIEGELIHVRLSGKTTGWVGIGFAPEKAMQGANIIIGAVKNGKVKIEDHYGDRKRGHSSDKKLGGKDHVLNPMGTEENGNTTISFSFPLDSGEKWDKPINPGQTGRIMIAYGTGRDSLRSGHAYRGVYEINYSTGETKKIK